MEKNRNSYLNIIKATALFGGMKFFQILISIIRSKLIAILLGPNGMGIAGLLTSTTEMIGTASGFGLRTSGIRDVSQAYSSGDETRKNKTITVLRKLVFFTGGVGSIVTFLLAKYLSEWAFGNGDYETSFKIISIILLFNQINIGQVVLLQGSFRYKDIAKSTLYGNLFGLILTIPLYYIYGLKGIVPAIIISSFIQLFFSWAYSKNIRFEKIHLSAKEVFTEGRVMLTLGIVIALTGFATQGFTYVLRIFISRFGSLADVGLYTAGIAIASTYVGLVLNAMGTDYAPRLSAVADNQKELINTINKQAILLITVLAPVIIIFIVFINQIVLLLYTIDFVEITGMIEWVLLGMIFRAVSWTISFSFIARGDSKVFFFNELFIGFFSLCLSSIGYYFLGFEGLGIAFLLTYVLYAIQMYIFSRKRFNFSFSNEFFLIFLQQTILSIVFFIIIKIAEESIWRYIIGIIFLIISLIVSYGSLKKMVDLSYVIQNIKKKVMQK